MGITMIWWPMRLGADAALAAHALPLWAVAAALAAGWLVGFTLRGRL